MRSRQDLIQLALWGGAIGCLVMAFRTAGIAGPQGPDMAPLLAWGGAGLVTGAIALGYSLSQYFHRPHPE